MDPREELTALRRMAELEAKASGASVPVVAPQVVTAPDTRPAWDKASTGDIVAGLPATRILAGAVSPVVGALQIGANIGDAIAKKMGNDPVFGKWLTDQISSYEASKKRGMAALGDTPSDVAGLVGSTTTGATALKGVVPATTYLGKVAQGIGIGAAAGATTPSSTPGLTQTAVQAGTGAMLGGTVPIVAPLVQGTYRAIIEPMSARGQATIKQRALVDAAGTRAPQVLNALRDPTQNIVPGSVPTAGEAAVPAGSAEFSALQKSSSKVLPSAYLARADSQKAAQLNQLRTVGQDKAALAAAEATREANALVNYKLAETAGIDPQMATALQPQIENLMNRPIMQAVRQDAVDWAANRSLATPDFGSVQGLDYMKKALDRQIARAASRQDAVGKADLATLMQNKNDLLATIKEIAPAYDIARGTFAAESVPVNQMRVGQYLENKLIPNLGDEAPLRASTFAGAVRDAPSTLKHALTNSPRFEELTQVLTPQQMSAVNSVVKDLERNARFEHMATKGTSAGPSAMNLATESIGGGGSSKLPGLLSRVAAVANMLIGRAEGQLNKKLAMELAKEMLSSTATANMLEQGILRRTAANNLGKFKTPATIAGTQAVTNQLGQ